MVCRRFGVAVLVYRRFVCTPLVNCLSTSALYKMQMLTVVDSLVPTSRLTLTMTTNAWNIAVRNLTYYWYISVKHDLGFTFKRFEI